MTDISEIKDALDRMDDIYNELYRQFRIVAEVLESALESPDYSTHKGDTTPWGKADYSEELAPGITWHGTPSHGGCHVAAALNDAIHPAWRRDGWYEEDCEWAIVAYHYPGAFPGRDERATDTLRDWFPLEYQQVTGVVLKPEESYMLRR